jgi:hypothetical protein
MMMIFMGSLRHIGMNHDASGALYVMAPAVAQPPNIYFSPDSITAMRNYLDGTYSSRPCLENVSFTPIFD